MIERETVPLWSELTSVGHRMGRPDAKVTILEFSDFECPFCRRFSEVAAAVRKAHGDDVAHVFVHYPLTGHRFARPAAHVAECAAAQGRFEEMHDLLFVKQDSLGLKEWSSFAKESGVRNISEFSGCLRDTSKARFIDAGLAAGRSVDVRGTPTVVINGTLYRQLPPDSLSDIVKDLLSKR